MEDAADSSPSTNLVLDPHSNTKRAFIAIPNALPPDQRLNVHGGPEGKPFHAWSKAMLRLFRANGVLDIMKDAVDLSARKARHSRVKQAGAPEGTNSVVLSGAETATTADLNVWDSSDDMTLLLRADALIDASLTENTSRFVVDIDNPHEKWEALEIWSDFFDWKERNKKEEDLDDWAPDLTKGADVNLKNFMPLRADVLEHGMERGNNDLVQHLVFTCDTYLGGFERNLGTEHWDRVHMGHAQDNGLTFAKFCTGVFAEAFDQAKTERDEEMGEPLD